MTHEAVLFDGRLGTQRIRVWLERRGDGIALLSHDIGSALVFAFLTDELESVLEIDAAHTRALAAALRGGPADAMQLLANRYRGDSAATTHLRQLLAEHGIPHRVSLV